MDLHTCSDPLVLLVLFSAAFRSFLVGAAVLGGVSGLGDGLPSPGDVSSSVCLLFSGRG